MELDNDPELTIEKICENLPAIQDYNDVITSIKKKYYLTCFGDNKILFPNLKIVQRIISNPKKYKTLKVYSGSNNYASNGYKSYTNYGIGNYTAGNKFSSAAKDKKDAYKHLLNLNQDKNNEEIDVGVNNKKRLSSASDYESRAKGKKYYEDYSYKFNGTGSTGAEKDKDQKDYVPKSNLSNNSMINNDDSKTDNSVNISQDYKRNSYKPLSPKSKKYSLQNEKDKEDLTKYMKKGYGSSYIPAGEQDNTEGNLLLNLSGDGNQQSSSGGVIQGLSYKKYLSEKRNYRAEPNIGIESYADYGLKKSTNSSSNNEVKKPDGIPVPDTKKYENSSNNSYSEYKKYENIPKTPTQIGTGNSGTEIKKYESLAQPPDFKKYESLAPDLKKYEVNTNHDLKKYDFIANDLKKLDSTPDMKKYEKVYPSGPGVTHDLSNTSSNTPPSVNKLGNETTTPFYPYASGTNGINNSSHFEFKNKVNSMRNQINGFNNGININSSTGADDINNKRVYKPMYNRESGDNENVSFKSNAIPSFSRLSEKKGLKLNYEGSNNYY